MTSSSPILRKLPAVVILGIIWLLSSLPNPPMPDLGFRFTDKLFHAIAFAAFAAAFCLWLPDKRWHHTPLRSFLFVIAVAIAAGILDELHQRFVPNRVSSVSDLVADALGAIAGAATCGIILSFRSRRKLVQN